MSETISFKSADSKFICTVKSSFAQKVDGSNINAYELVNDWNLGQYLHNPIGPALINLQSGEEHYFLDGRQLNEKDSEKIIQVRNFNNNLNSILE